MIIIIFLCGNHFLEIQTWSIYENNMLLIERKENKFIWIYTYVDIYIWFGYIHTMNIFFPYFYRIQDRSLCWKLMHLLCRFEFRNAFVALELLAGLRMFLAVSFFKRGFPEDQIWSTIGFDCTFVIIGLAVLSGLGCR